MDIKVCKFGGTSCANAQTLKLIADIVQSDAERAYIVVSAPGKQHSNDTKVTDLLYSIGDGGDITDSKYLAGAFSDIEQRFSQIIEGLKIEFDLKAEIKKITNDLKDGAGLDYLVSRGEYLLAKIVAKMLDFEFVEAADIIKFNARNMFDDEYTNELVQARLSQLPNAVIPGFYGSDINGAIKILGRGGSDISGAIIARGASAKVYENWTDVNGFLVCDPHIVQNPLLIDMLTYRELRELSYMGANVLHPESIFPVRKAQIPINIKNTFDPKQSGTMIVPTKLYLRNEFEREERMITGIAGKKDFISINITKSMLNNEAGIVRKLLGVLEPYNISFEHMPTGIDTISLIIDSHNIDKRCLPQIVEEIIRLISPDYIEVDRNLALIAIVGHELIRRRGAAAKIFAEIAGVDVNVKMIDLGSSEMNIILGVENCDLERTICALYKLALN